MSTILEYITSANLVPLKCPIIKQNDKIATIRTVVNESTQGVAINNINPVCGKYRIEIILSAIGCNLYWHGTYDGYEKIPLLDGNNIFDIMIKKTGKTI